MLKIKPILTEKSMILAKSGKYSFWVPKNLTKSQIKRVISDLFKVKVKNIKTMNYKRREKTSMMRRTKSVVPARKKAIVSLKDGDKIALFGEEEKKTKKKKKAKK